MAAEKSQVTKYFIQRIQAWMDSEMARDEQFRARVEAVKDKKTVEGACNYVLKCVKDSGQCGYDDAEVYGMVRHFFDEDDVTDPGDQHPSRVVVSGKVDLTAEQIEEAKEAARQQYYNEIREAEERKRKEAEERERQRKAEIRERKIAEQSAQQDLFGF